MRYSFLAILALTASSCTNTGVEVTRYHEDGRLKPAVLVTQLIDTSSFDVPWSLSEELTDLISREISRNPSLYVSTESNFLFSESPFGSDLTWIKEECAPHEFAVFLELVEHSYTPANKERRVVPLETALSLDMAVRIRVVDLRKSTPRVILQELVRDSYYIPKTLIPTDYTVDSWGTIAYRKSPMSIAHMQLVQNIADRLSDYILLAKSR